MQKTITTFLTFDDRAEEAVTFYVSVFPNSKITSTSRYGEGMPLPAGTLMVATFELDGQQFMALNGGSSFRFTEGFSLYVECQTQEEVDMYWEKLSAGGGSGRCGWLEDRFGVSWQIIPAILGTLMGDKDPAKSGRVMQAVMRMTKLDIAGLKRAYDGT